jgi:hypothetical protein
MPECAKAHIQLSRFSKFFRGGFLTPTFWRGWRGLGREKEKWKAFKEREGKGRRGKGREEEVGAPPNKNLSYTPLSGPSWAGCSRISGLYLYLGCYPVLCEGICTATVDLFSSWCTLTFVSMR